PEGPFTTYSNDDGTYALRDLPEGVIRINFFRAGYDTKSLDAISLRSGEDFAVGDLEVFSRAQRDGVEALRIVAGAEEVDANDAFGQVAERVGAVIVAVGGERPLR